MAADPSAAVLAKAHLVATALKLLLIPSYRSTDFEVHRNWLAVTALPIEHWYRESTSQWTLDYPPLFAWFQRALAYLARLVDPAMLELSEAPVETPSTVLFLRLSVSLLADAVLLLATYMAVRIPASQARAGDTTRAALAATLLLNPALLIVDHIHFQYNGMLIGVLLMAIHCAQRDAPVGAAILFASTLFLKHLFVYAAPAFTVYLFARYCCGGRGGWAGLWTFCKLGGAVVGVAALSLGPIVATGQLGPMMERLFPFERGLLHASWAPNVWAVYAAADKGLSLVFRRSGSERERAAFTGGLVAVQSFEVLPNVGAGHCLGLAGLAMLPALVACARGCSSSSSSSSLSSSPLSSPSSSPSSSPWAPPVGFHRVVGYALLCGFMFGFHVHEKAIIPPMIILMFAELYRAQAVDWGARTTAVFLSVVATAVQFPLLFTLPEHPIKHLLALLYAIVAAPLWLREHPGVQGRAVSLLSGRSLWMAIRRSFTWWQLGVVCGGVCVEAYVGSGVHGLVWGGRLPFLPLMIQSLFYAGALMMVWLSEAVYFCRVGFGRSGGLKGKKKLT